MGAQWLSGRVLDSRPRVRASPASLRCGPWARHIYPSLVLVQPKKTRPCLTERLLMGRKESNKKTHDQWNSYHCTSDSYRKALFLWHNHCITLRKRYKVLNKHTRLMQLSPGNFQTVSRDQEQAIFTRNTGKRRSDLFPPPPKHTQKEKHIHPRYFCEDCTFTS